MIFKLKSENFFKLIFFLIFLLIGLFTYKDYGISFDEQTQRINNGSINYNFIIDKDSKPLLEGNEKYHGPALEILIFSIERIFNFTDARSIYLLRHLITFLFFYLSSICFYALLRKISGNPILAFAGTLMFILSPRIFAESFYNSKDIGFLSLFSISLYTLDRFLSNKNFSNMFVHALITGLMIDIRLLGILIPALTIGYLLLDFLFEEGKIKNRKKYFFILTGYPLIQFVFVICFWPVLWLNPLHQFALAFHEMNQYPWNGNVLFNGAIFPAEKLPWFYLPLWILITTPVMYLLFFFTGFLSTLFQLIKRKWAFYIERKILLSAFILFFLPLTYIIFFHSTVYDGWRHVYFLYAPFCIIASWGLKSLYEWIIRKLPYLRHLFILTIGFGFALIISLIIKDHPHQNVYFNSLAKKMYFPIENKFEMDYWGLSYRNGLEYILANDTSSNITIGTESFAGELNLQILNEEQRNRISYIHVLDHPFGVKYYLADFRGGKILDKNKLPKPIHKISNTAGDLLYIFKLETDFIKDTLMSMRENFENDTGNLFISSAEHYSGRYSNFASGDHVSKTFHIQIDSELIRYPSILFFSSQVLFKNKFPDIPFVMDILRNRNHLYWLSADFRGVIKKINQWQVAEYNTTIPSDINPGDEIAIYFWPLSKKDTIFLDDMELHWISFKPMFVEDHK